MDFHPTANAECSCLCGLQMYNRGHSMATSTFWRYSVGTATLGGAFVFWFCYYGTAVSGVSPVIAHCLLYVIT
jgi:hypothetical protein